MWRRHAPDPSASGPAPVLDVHRIRQHFDFPAAGRVVTNNAASTQPPRELLELYRSLSPWYENVHRGQSSASQHMTGLFEESYDTIATWLNARSRRSIVTYRNTTEAINAVMYSLLSEFRDGDNVVTTTMEHNSNFVPWYALSREILPRFGRRVDHRLARFDPVTGELDLEHLAQLVDARTKLVCVSGASNFLGTKPPLRRIRAIADDSGYPRPDGDSGSLLLVDAAQLVPSSSVDVQALDVDYLAFSFHKLLAPFGIGVLYAKEHLLEQALPFLYGGDMIAEGQVAPDRVSYNALPWKYAAGTPNILGVIASAQALRLLLDLVAGGRPRWFGTAEPLARDVVVSSMDLVARHTTAVTEQAMRSAQDVAGLTVYGPPPGAPRSPLVAFTVEGMDPLRIAEGLNELGVESRAGCHCATLAHRDLGLVPSGSCRLSFALYSSPDDVDSAMEALRRVTAPARIGRVGLRAAGRPYP
ncbi:aminotransferase class V-fold PLP-dependent enzyme [Geodermatophilus maliterrae]|uniref:Aminotransferase class V-fold PLP-dependent enzyme n=1 Tax=Geodermatophilus maliterrae TaxID=3162531 RepID=A0ABV3XEK8_9ACTN